MEVEFRVEVVPLMGLDAVGPVVAGVRDPGVEEEEEQEGVVVGGATVSIPCSDDMTSP